MTGGARHGADVGELVGYLRLDSRHFTAGLAAAGRALQATGRDTARPGSQASALAATVTATALKFGALAGAANLAGGSLAVLGGGLVTASGSLLLLPGAAVAGATALGVLKLGLQGFGDALSNMDDPEKFAESIAELAPATQETAVAVRDLKPVWDDLAGGVQQELFTGTSDIVRELGAAYLPSLHSGMVDVAGSFRVAEASAAAFLRETQTMRDVEAFLDSTSRGVGGDRLAVGRGQPGQGRASCQGRGDQDRVGYRCRYRWCVRVAVGGAAAVASGTQCGGERA